MTTLEDVARHAGLSTATVSKVLSNTPYFSETTRQKVMQAVEELGYVPHLGARALSKGKTHIIAVVFPHIHDTFFKDPLVLRILEGIEQECTERNYNLLLSTPRLTDGQLDPNYIQLTRSGYLDGMIALDNIPSVSLIPPALKNNIPVVSLGYHPHVHYVLSDEASGGRILMEHILRLGHRRIGIISVPDALNFAIQERLRGMRETCQHYQLNFDSLSLVYGDFSISSGQEKAAELLALEPKLSAIIALNDRMAMGAILQAQLLGRHVPSQLSVVGYDNIPSAAVFMPALTTIDQQAPELGRRAAQMLFALLNNEETASSVIPINLIVRASSARFGGSQPLHALDGKV